MKRLIVLFMALTLGFYAYSQDLGAFADGFTAFATDAAPTLSYNATVGNNWSDAYIGQFPHFGVGLALGATMVPAESVKSLFEAMAIALPAELDQVGLPIPAVALSAKIGGFFLPFDIGLKGMILPESVTKSLSAQGIAADYKLIGGNIRVPLLKEKLLIPDLSVGLGYNHLSGSIAMDLKLGTNPTYSYETHNITIDDPSLGIGWKTDSFDITAQLSKKLLFLRPYLAGGFSFGKSSFTGGLKGNISEGTTGDIDAIKAALIAAGQDVSMLDNTGFEFGAESKDPVFRLYGGLSLDLFFIVLDLQGVWVPKGNSLGASAMLRLQL